MVSEVNPVKTVATEQRPEVRYMLRRNGLVLTKPEKVGSVFRWETEEVAGDQITYFPSDRSANNARNMIAHDAEIVIQVKVEANQ